MRVRGTNKVWVTDDQSEGTLILERVDQILRRAKASGILAMVDAAVIVESGVRPALQAICDDMLYNMLLNHPGSHGLIQFSDNSVVNVGRMGSVSVP